MGELRSWEVICPSSQSLYVAQQSSKLPSSEARPRAWPITAVLPHKGTFCGGMGQKERKGGKGSKRGKQKWSLGLLLLEGHWHGTRVIIFISTHSMTARKGMSTLKNKNYDQSPSTRLFLFRMPLKEVNKLWKQSSCISIVSVTSRNFMF